MRIWPFQYQGLAAPPPAEVTIPRVSQWKATYPDRVPAAPALAAAILAGACFFVGYEAIRPTAAPTPSAAAQVFPGRQIQYQASAAPFVATLPAPPTTIDKWSPQYPATIATLPDRNRAAGWIAFSGYEAIRPTAAPTPASLTQVFPGRQVQYQASAAPFTAALTTRTLTPADWGPTYPSRLPRAVTLDAAYQQYLSIEAQPLEVPPEGWLPSYPVVVLPRALPTADQLAYVSGSSVLPIADLRWAAVYPDHVDRLAYLTAHQLAIGPGLSSSTIPITDLRWQAHYPDRLDRVALLTADQLAFVTGATSAVLPVTDLRWQAIYPDRLDRPPRLLDSPFLFVEPFPRPAITTTLEWLPTYPVWLARLAPPQPTGSVLPPFVPITDLRWLASYPALLLPGRALHPAALPPVAFAPRPEHTIALDAAAVYPDWLPRVLYPTTQQLAYVANLVPEQTLAGAWTPIYPDTIDRRVLLVNQIPATVLPPFVPVTDLRWLASYPDRLVPLAGLRADLHQPFTLDPFPRLTLIVPLSWLARYPDAIDRLVYLTAHQLPWVSVASTLIWSGPVPTPCPDTGTGGEPLVILGRGW